MVATARSAAPIVSTPLVTRSRPRNIQIDSPALSEAMRVPKDIAALATQLAQIKAEESKVASAKRKAEKELSKAIMAAGLAEKELAVIVGLDTFDFGILAKETEEYSAKKLYDLVGDNVFWSIAKVNKGDIETFCGEIALEKTKVPVTKAPAFTFSKRK